MPARRIPVLGKRQLTRKLSSSSSAKPCRFRRSQNIRDRIELEKSPMIRTENLQCYDSQGTFLFPRADLERVRHKTIRNKNASRHFRWCGGGASHPRSPTRQAV